MCQSEPFSESELVQFVRSAFLPVHDAKVQHFSALVKFYCETHCETHCETLFNCLIVRVFRKRFLRPLYLINIACAPARVYPSPALKTADSHREDCRFSPRELAIPTARTADSHHENCRFSPRELPILTARTADSHHENCRFPPRELAIPTARISSLQSPFHEI